MESLEKGEIVEGDVVVIRYEGPKGGPGMREMLMITGAIKGAGLDGQGQGIKAETVNGGIKLQLGGLKGRLRATTVNGGITFSAKGAEAVEVKKHRVTAHFPGSDQSIEISTVNGGITLE